MNQSAIAMLQKTIELMNKDTCIELMPEMIPPLLTVNFLFCFFSFFLRYLILNTRRFVFDCFSHGIVKHQVYAKQQFFVWYQYI
jgi:hypothetical protein